MHPLRLAGSGVDKSAMQAAEPHFELQPGQLSRPHSIAPQLFRLREARVFLVISLATYNPVKNPARAWQLLFCLLERHATSTRSGSGFRIRQNGYPRQGDETFLRHCRKEQPAKENMAGAAMATGGFSGQGYLRRSLEGGVNPFRRRPAANKSREGH